MKKPRKALGGLIAGAAVLAAGLLVKPESLGSVCLALTSIYAIFATGHSLQETLVTLKDKKTDGDAC